MNDGSKIRVAIVDDEPLARRRIRKLLARDGDVETVCDCADGYEAEQRFSLTDADEGGLRVTLEIPFTTSGAAGTNGGPN